MTVHAPSEGFARSVSPPQPLRVSSIITSLTSGGAEILVTNLNGAFAAKGASGTVVAFCDAGTLGNSAEMEAELAAQIDRTGCRFESLSLGRRRRLLPGILALRRHLAETRPDVVHAHTVRAVAMLAFCGYRGPVVFTYHNSRLSFPPGLFTLLDRVVHHYVAISNDTAGIYRHLSKRPFTLIQNAPAARYRAAGPRLVPERPCRILSVGAISDQKNYPLLIETARILRDRATPACPAPLLRVAGGGEGLETLRAQVRELGLEDVVQFLGERRDVPELLARSDLFLNTSHYEGFSVAILEAMAMGLPVVATDVSGNRGLVRPAQNGLLCPVDRPQALAAGIMRLMQDTSLYRQFSAGALTTSREYTIENAASRHLELYSSLLRRRAPQKD
ncbi:glycosyltransferase [Novosphingobium lindaniclasticum]